MNYVFIERGDPLLFYFQLTLFCQEGEAVTVARTKQQNVEFFLCTVLVYDAVGFKPGDALLLTYIAWKWGLNPWSVMAYRYLKIKQKKLSQVC